MHRGYVPVWRKLKDSTFYRDSEAVHLWLHILFEAQHSEKKEWFKGEEVILQEGEFTTGRKRLASETGISESKIQRLLKKFETCHMIEQQTNSANRLISITNYKSHKTSEQQVNNKRTASEQQVNNVRTHSKNVNNSSTEELEEITPEPPTPKFNAKKYSEQFDWIDNDLWIEWIDHKKRVKASITERSLKANVKKLEGFGVVNSKRIIEYALEKNWKDFYIDDDLEKELKIQDDDQFSNDIGLTKYEASGHREGDNPDDLF